MRRSAIVIIVQLVAGLLMLIGAENRGWASLNNCPGGAASSLQWWYSENGYDTKMSAVNNNYCWLSLLQGDWHGQNENANGQGAYLTVESDGYWHLITYNSEDQGWAYCQPASCFIGEYPGYTVDWNYSQGPGNYHFISAVADTCGNGCNNNYNRGTGWPQIPGTQKSITMLAGYPLSNGGTFDFNEYAAVHNNGGPDDVEANTCVDNEGCWGIIDGSFTSIFVGTLYTTAGVWPYRTGYITGNADLDMGTTLDKGICYIVRVEGAWRGSYAELYHDASHSNEWHAYVSSGVSGWVSVNFECMAYIINH
jgi:hypothetical protein